MKVGNWTVAMPMQPASIEPAMPIYTVQFLEDCEIKGSKFYKGQILQALADGVFNAVGKAMVYDWNTEEFVPITDSLPKLPMGGQPPQHP
jgi:hypothetical protein